MYINKLDEIVDKIIDDFFSDFVINQKTFGNILKEPNFVKYQIQINKIINDYISSIDMKELNSFIKNNENINTIIQMIKKYIAYYVFLTIGFHYQNKNETFINNVIEFSKNKSSFNFRIDNFFNSESNANIIKFYYLIKNITTIVDSEKSSLEKFVNEKKFNDAVSFLNQFGDDFVTNSFKLKNLNKNKFTQAHNIIKTIIISELYTKNDKDDIKAIILASEKEKAEYTFIDIVVPKEDYIDFNAIENVLSEEDIENGLSNDIYEILTKTEDSDKIKIITHDEKILNLINNDILVPVVDDFLLYHKDSEKYDKTPYDPAKFKKKKEDTRIKYITNKIDTVTDLYSKNIKKNVDIKKKIEKFFYLPLSDRKAILVNNNEEIDVINKLTNQGLRSQENELYNDLMNFRNYPYINFKDFKDDGFSIKTNKTIDVVRYVTFEKINKSLGAKNIQLRVGSEDQILNVVGFILLNKGDNLHCLLNNQVINIKDNNKITKKTENGYKNMLNHLKNLLIKRNNIKNSVLWLLNLEKDEVKLESYNQLSKMDKHKQMKIVVSKIYDDLVELIFGEIYNIVDKKKEISFYNFNRLIENINKKIFEIPKDSILFNNLKQYIVYEKHIKVKDSYDEEEDIFFGLQGDNVIKLPSIKTDKEDQQMILSKEKILVKKEEESAITEVERVGAICQHFLTWDNITAIRKKNPNKFNSLLFEFISQYIIENKEGDFICKSCSNQVNIKNYVTDGSHDSDGRFITFSMPVEIPIEDLPEYQKYKTVIRNVDKLIERISSVINIPYFIGSGIQTKNRRRVINKNVIDLLLIHNKIMNKIYKNRKENIDKKYGIGKDLTNLFVFPLENSIFIYSSKDKDFYKPKKKNNVLIYTLLMIILELNNTQILYLIGDRLCNYFRFIKYGYLLFENLKIIKNDKGDMAFIKDYKTLCYVLYFASCMITKNNIWSTEEEGNKKKKFDPIIQKVIIHTFVDFLNSILEIYSNKKRHYIYEIISVRFFDKLNTTFNNDEIMKKIRNIENKRIVTVDNKKKYLVTKVKPVKIANKFEVGDYNGIKEYPKCTVSRYQIKLKEDSKLRYFNINNITNCPDGRFHIWKTLNKNFVCELCSLNLSNIKFNLNESENIIEKHKYLRLIVQTKSNCNSSNFNRYLRENKVNCEICRKCKNKSIENLTNRELDELKNNFIKMEKYLYDEQQKKIKNINGKIEKRDKKVRENVNRIKSQYSETKVSKDDYFGFIKDFLDIMENIIGKGVNINNNNIYLKHNLYVIDHDHRGYPLDKPIYLSDKEQKINFKRDHHFFKTDVLYYTNYKVGKVDVFYDATSLLLLGYKEQNRDFEKIKNKNIHLKINYSIGNKLRMLGYPSKNIQIDKRIRKLKKIYKNIKDEELIKNIVSEISRDRIDKLKKVISDIIRFIYKIKYNYDEEFDEEDLDQLLINKYKNKLAKMDIKDNKGKRIYGKWKSIKYGIFLQDLSNKDININPNEKYVNFKDINDYNYHGNVILFYIVDEMSKLIEVNKNKFIKVNLVYFLIDIINRMHDLFNTDYQKINVDIKRFTYSIDVKSSIYTVEEMNFNDGDKDVSGETEGFYGEYIDKDDDLDKEDLEKIEEATEEFEAIDMDQDMDYEIDYKQGANLGPLMI